MRQISRASCCDALRTLHYLCYIPDNNAEAETSLENHSIKSMDCTVKKKNQCYKRQRKAKEPPQIKEDSRYLKTKCNCDSSWHCGPVKYMLQKTSKGLLE